MASTSSQNPSSETQTTSLPHHQSSPTTNQQDQTTVDTTKIPIPDGRRNSAGEPVPSPTETWKPTFTRKQSWNQEDLKRRYVMTELEKDKSKQGGGFSEK